MAEPPSSRRTTRRSGERVAARFRVRFRSLDHLVATYTQDISRGGLFIQTDQFVPVGTVVLVSLELDDGQPPAAALARVAYVLGPEQAEQRRRKAGMGMEFVETPASLDERIAAKLAQQLGGEEGDEAVQPARVLVVEDSPAQRERLVGLVEALGHSVRAAQNGLEAVGAMVRETPDLVLSDVQMPVMDGWQLLRIVRSRPALAHVPVVFLTELGGDEERLRGYRLGVDDYLAKPLDEDELRARIERVLRRSRARPSQSADRGVLRGDLSLVSLPSVLAFVHAERRSGLLLVASPPHLATLHVHEGNVVQVDLSGESRDRQGSERLFHVLDWHAGWFELSPGEVSPRGDIDIPTSHALIEHARRRDEAG